MSKFNILVTHKFSIGEDVFFKKDNQLLEGSIFEIKTGLLFKDKNKVLMTDNKYSILDQEGNTHEVLEYLVFKKDDVAFAPFVEEKPIQEALIKEKI